MESLILSMALTLITHYASGTVANAAVKETLLALRDAIDAMYPRV